MRLLISLTVLAVLVVAAGIYYRASSEASREERVAGWAHSLIWQALDLPVTPRFSDSQARQDPDNGSRWVVRGKLEIRGAMEPGPPMAFAASMRAVCGDARVRECWRLEELIVDDRTLFNAIRLAGDAAAGEAVPPAPGNAGLPSIAGSPAPRNGGPLSQEVPAAGQAPLDDPTVISDAVMAGRRTGGALDGQGGPVGNEAGLPVASGEAGAPSGSETPAAPPLEQGSTTLRGNSTVEQTAEAPSGVAGTAPPLPRKRPEAVPEPVSGEAAE